MADWRDEWGKKVEAMRDALDDEPEMGQTEQATKAEALLARMKADHLRIAAARALLVDAHQAQRRRALAVEREAAVPAPPASPAPPAATPAEAEAEDQPEPEAELEREPEAEAAADAEPEPEAEPELYRGRWTHGTKAAVERGCGCAVCTEVRTRAERVDRELRTQVRSVSIDHAARLQMRWTPELRRTAFQLGDGTNTTWGRATLTQHRERALMFDSQATTAIEGSSRHRAAVADLTDAGVDTLDELVTADARAER